MADSDLWGDLGYKPPGQPQQASATPAPPDPELKALVASKAAQYGIPSDIADRWVQQESSYNPKATSKKGARGLTQLMPKTAETYGVTDVEDPAQNVEGGAHYLADLKAQFGSWDKALAAYNAGPDAVTKAGGVPDIPETQNYVKTIMGQGTPAVGDDLWGALGYKPASAGSADEAQFTADHPKMVSPGELKPSDLNTYKTLLQGGALKPQDPYGSEHNPFFNTDPKQVPAGGYYVSDGKVQRAPGGTKESSALAGLGQGVGDVATTIMHAIPGSDDSDVKNALIAGQMLYGAKYGGDLKSGAGRFTGQLLGSAPMLAAGGEVAAPALEATGPVGEFLAGRGGQAMARGLPRLAVRGGSLSTAGAATGAGAAALTSSANEEPLGEQMASGAAGGALVGPVAPVVGAGGRWLGKTARSLVEPLTEGGRGKIINRIVGAFGEGGNMHPDASEIIQGSTPSLAEATANPGIATLERTVRLTRPTPFAERDLGNAAARGNVLDSIRGDEQTVADLVASRKDAVAKAETAAFKQAGVANPKPVVDAIDAALAAPEAHMDEVARPLQALRDKVVTPAPETSPTQRADFNRAVAKTFGADAPALTPEVLSEARDRLGAKFEEIAGKTKVTWDDKAVSDIVHILHDTAQVVPESSMPPLFKQLANIASTVKEGEGGSALSGQSYQALTKKGAALTSLQNSGDPTVRDAANKIREALDDALERSVGSTPEGKAALAELRDTRLQYKNLKTVEAALRSAGPDKQVAPQAVLSAVKRNFGQFAYKGGGPLGDAAEAAVKEEAGRAPTTETNPKQLFGMRQSLSDAIDKLTAKGTDAGDTAARHLGRVRDALDAEIEKAAPGYGDYLKTAKSTAEPVAATKFLQSLKLTDMTGKMTLGRVSSALDRIAEMRRKPGDNPAKAITQDTLDQLQAIHADLLRANNRLLGAPANSHTAQHLATGAIADQMNVPLAVGLGAIMHHPLVGPAVGAGKLVLKNRNEKLLDELANRLLTPEAPPVSVKAAKPPGKIAGAARRVGKAVLPATAGMISNRLVTQ